VALALLLYVIVEIAAIAAVAWAIGIGWTILLLVAGALAGGLLARHEGGKAWRALSGTVRSGRSPQSELTDGMLVGAGGVLILAPGFISDLAGFGVLLPPMRGLLRKRWVARLEGRSTEQLERNSRGRIVVDSEIVDDHARRKPRGSRPLGDTVFRRSRIRRD
jgi:UPF0716 protein FxsA